MNPFLFVLLLSLSTALPRILPALLARTAIHPAARKVLLLLPYTCMSALIFPGILSATPGGSASGLAGGACAVLCAFCRLPILVTVLMSVAVCLVFAII